MSGAGLCLRVYQIRFAYFYTGISTRISEPDLVNGLHVLYLSNCC